MPFPYSKCASLIIIISKLDVCVRGDVANDTILDTRHGNNATTLYNKYNHAGTYFEFPFKSSCQKGKEKKMKRDETEHSREKKLETTCDDGEAKYEIDAKSLH